MKSLRSGLAPVSDAIFELAESLLNRLPDDAYVLTGITLTDRDGQERVTIDLIAITNTAVVVGVDIGRQTATPKQAGRFVGRVQQAERLSPPLLIYPCWLGDNPPPGTADQSPALPHLQAVVQFVVRAGEQGGQPAPNVAAALFERLEQADDSPIPGTRRVGAVRGFRKVLQDLGDLPGRVDAGLQEQIRQPLPLRRAEPIRPADINRELQEVMLARENLLEDANYGKIVPNDFIVELNAENYERHYRPIEADVCRQWQDKLLEALNTANSRRGRKEYRFTGPVRVRIQPVPNLPEDEVKIYSRVRAGSDRPGPSTRPSCLELLPDGRTFPLRSGMITLGRDSVCDIFVDRPDVQEKRLVSSQHAYIVCERDACRLYDGSPEGRPSINGTYVNGQPVQPNGTILRDGDVVVLAALDRQNPRPDRPGVAGFVFRQNC
jgi:hypothetical protein